MNLNRIFAGLIACAVMGVSLPCAPYLNVTMVSASEETVTASGQCGENLTWTLDEEGVLTISGTGDMSDFSAADGSNPAPWCEYGSYITKAVIEEGVTSIGNGAFDSSGNNVFSALTEISIPASVNKISEYKAFYNCKKLLSINVAEANTAYCSVEGVLFNKEMTELMLYPSQKIDTEYTIPEGVVSLADDAFDDNLNITHIGIPDSVTYIGECVFTGCENLSSFSFSENIEYIGQNTFSGTSWLEMQKETDPVVYVNNILVDGKGAKGEIIIPDGVTAISGCAFVDWTYIREVTGVVIPDSVQYIGRCAFYGHPIVNVTLPENGMYIDVSAFGDTPWIEAQQEINPVVVSNNAIIEAGECSDNPVIPENVSRIAGDAFYKNVNLTEITIPQNVTEIGTAAFQACENLESITILNPDCEILVEMNMLGEPVETIPETATIYSYSGSTAQAYAEKYGRTFVALDDAPSETVYGDANCDGDVLVNDAVLVMAYATNAEACTISEQGLLNADVYQSGDGVAVTDAAAIQKYLTKLIVAAKAF